MQFDIARKKFNTRDYHKMVEAGILMERERVELIEGEIVEMSPIGRHHAAATSRATMLFATSFAETALVRVAQPLVVGDWSEPEPDICVVRMQTDFYLAGHPVPQDVFFLMEISDTTIEFDRRVKLGVYAAAQIPEFWILDLNTNRLEVYRDPAGGAYRVTETLDASDQVTPAALPGFSFDVGALLP